MQSMLYGVQSWVTGSQMVQDISGQLLSNLISDLDG